MIVVFMYVWYKSNISLWIQVVSCHGKWFFLSGFVRLLLHKQALMQELLRDLDCDSTMVCFQFEQFLKYTIQRYYETLNAADALPCNYLSQFN